MLLILGILMLVMCYMAYQKVRITKEFVILLVVFFGMLTTYFIPHMHERYLYLTDAFLLIYTLIRVRRFPLFVTASFLTVVGYGQYLTKQAPLVSYGALAFIQLALLVLISLDVYRYLHDPANVLEGGTLESDRIESERTEGRGRIMTGFDDFLRTLLFRKFCVGKVKFDFMEALLAVCITGVGFALRTAFPDSGMPDMRILMEEWYLAVCAGVLVKRMTGRVRRGLYAYGILMILPTIVMDGTIMGSNASIGALYVSVHCFIWKVEPRGCSRSWQVLCCCGMSNI